MYVFKQYLVNVLELSKIWLLHGNGQWYINYQALIESIINYGIISIRRGRYVQNYTHFITKNTKYHKNDLYNNINIFYDASFI